MTKKLMSLCMGALFAGVALLAFSCAQQPVSTPSTGSISLSFTTLADPASTGTVPQAYTGERALGKVDRFTLTLFNSEGAQVKTVTAEYENSGLTAASSLYTWEVPVGTGYTLRLETYNDAVSATTPAATGYSAAFDVSGGATVPVTITCKPVSAAPTPIGEIFGPFTIASGGEKWLSFTAVSFFTGMEYNAGTKDFFKYALYNDDGSVMRAKSTGSGKYTVYFPTIPGKTYNLAMYAPSGDTFTVRFFDFFAEYPIDATLELDTPLTGLALSDADDWDVYAFPVTKGNAYRVSMSFPDGEFARVIRVLDTAYASQIVNTTEFSETCFQAVNTGTYYLLISPDGGTGNYNIVISPVGNGSVTVHLADCSSVAGKTGKVVLSQSRDSLSNWAASKDVTYAATTVDETFDAISGGQYYARAWIDMDGNGDLSQGDKVADVSVCIDGAREVTITAADFGEVDAVEVAAYQTSSGTSPLSLNTVYQSCLYSNYDLDTFTVDLEVGKTYTIRLESALNDGAEKLCYNFYSSWYSFYSAEFQQAPYAREYTITVDQNPYKLMVFGRKGYYALSITQND